MYVDVVGVAGKDGVVPTYRLKSWYDFNACFIRIEDKKLGKQLKDDFSNEEADIFVPVLARRYAKANAVFWAGAASRLLDPKLDADERSLEKLIGELGSADYSTREKASKQLIQSAGGNTAFIKTALKNSKDEEVSARLRRVLAELAQSVAQADAANAAKQAGGETEAKLLINALPALQAPLLDKAILRLKALALAVEPKLAVPADVTPEALSAAWELRLFPALK
jgi:hypothetical protein